MNSPEILAFLETHTAALCARCGARISSATAITEHEAGHRELDKAGGNWNPSVKLKQCKCGRWFRGVATRCVACITQGANKAVRKYSKKGGVNQYQSIKRRNKRSKHGLQL